MSLREIDLSRRAFLFQQAREWDRQRWVVANLAALLGSKLTPQQILPIPLLDGDTEDLPKMEVTEEDKERLRKMAEKWQKRTELK